MTIESFIPKNKYLICIDINGCKDKKSNLKPFKNMKKQLSTMQEKADIAIVSNDDFNKSYEECKSLGITDFISVICNDSKIKVNGLTKRYPKDNVIIVGSNNIDLEIAKANNLYFYPIINGEEGNSWKKINSYLNLFFTKQMDYCQLRLIDEFEQKLKLKGSY